MGGAIAGSRPHSQPCSACIAALWWVRSLTNHSSAFHPCTLTTVRLYELHLGWHDRSWVERRLVEAFEVQDAALEFGGTARCDEAELKAAAMAAEAEGAAGALQLGGGGGEGEPAAVPA